MTGKREIEHLFLKGGKCKNWGSTDQLILIETMLRHIKNQVVAGNSHHSFTKVNTGDLL